MVTSILIKEDEINGDQNINEIKDTQILKEAAKICQFTSQNFVPEFNWSLGQGRCLDLAWYEVLHWAGALKDKEPFHDFFENSHTKQCCPLFFHAIFSYSITNLSEIISHRYKDILIPL
jgi:hypothetical protein